MFPAVCLVALALLALAACYLDVISFTLPNWLTAATAVLFFIFAGAMYFAGFLQLNDIGLATLAGAVTLALGIVLFALGGLGGGDVKYLAAAILWAAPVGLLDFIFTTSIAGAFVAIIYLVAPRLVALIVGQRARDAASASGFKRPMPYGVAISGGLAMVIWHWAVRLTA